MWGAEPPLGWEVNPQGGQGRPFPWDPVPSPGSGAGRAPPTRGRGEPSPGGLGPEPADSGTSDRGHRDNALDSGNGPGAVVC